MRRPLAALLLVLAAGCAAPPYPADYNIGLVKNGLFDEALEVLAAQGVHAERGSPYGEHIGLRVVPEQSYWATRVLLQWRRTQEPGAFVTREEFEAGLQNP